MYKEVCRIVTAILELYKKNEGETGMKLDRRFLAALLATFATTIVATPAAAGPIDEIVFFGDSISDTGNVWYATGGFPPPPYNQGQRRSGTGFHRRPMV